MQRGQIWSQSVIGSANTCGNQNAVKAELDIADMFSKLDISSESSLSDSFSSTLSQMRAVVQKYCNQNGILPSHVGLAGATDNISKFFGTQVAKL